MDQISTVVSSVPGYAPSQAVSVACRAPSRAGDEARGGGVSSDGDRVEISDRARELGSSNVILDGSVVRRDLVDRIRSEIDDGSYLTPEKIDQAAERLSQSLDLEA